MSEPKEDSFGSFQSLVECGRSPLLLVLLLQTIFCSRRDEKWKRGLGYSYVAVDRKGNEKRSNPGSGEQKWQLELVGQFTYYLLMGQPFISKFGKGENQVLNAHFKLSSVLGTLQCHLIVSVAF